MNPAPEDNFEQLQKLLALKRHEAPPPGYWNDFSAKVCARIEAAEAARPVSLWQRLFVTFDAKPIMACTYGLAVGGLTLFAVYYASNLGTESAHSPLGDEPSVVVSPALQSSPAEFAGNPFGGMEPNTNALNGSTPPSFLMHPGELKTERVDFKRDPNK